MTATYRPEPDDPCPHCGSDHTTACDIRTGAYIEGTPAALITFQGPRGYTLLCLSCGRSIPRSGDPLIYRQ